ncbi:CaiB/BaiF CoA transferase family protein [Desulfotignum balticum]|uniref:CaiB/BaiF CoA transferase family protein n=1 Tax=Desulfotignum balticum TaxID=115781 RepID=UPI00041F8E7C|nr:CoA transferase [Desulfotignum balticum]
MMTSLLSGIRILDLADEKASFCTKVLAQMGAQVIKIEKPGEVGPRKNSRYGSHFSGRSTRLSFLFNNTHKEGITLDIEHPRGKALFLELVPHAHAVVETYPAGYLKQINLDYETLSEKNQKLILVSVTGFGQTGPASRDHSCDLVAAATGGQMYVTGKPGAPPLKHSGNQSYMTGSLFAAFGILIALRKVRITGKGDHIDISLQESVTATLEHVMVRYFTEQVIPQRQGCLHWNGFTHILPCKDGWIQLTLLEQWDTLVGWMDSEGMAADLTEAAWKDPQYRKNNIQHIIEVVSEWTLSHTSESLFNMGQLMQFPWAPVTNPKEVLNSPQLESRQFFKKIPAGGNPAVTYPGLPFKLTPSLCDPQPKAPDAGEHNNEIFGGLLGLSEETIRKLTRQRVL